ncbi:hypothetical protein [Paraferrimonas sedimenticola]|uniref:Antitermination protein n=1 Tax=Paraferrimonas sedimenticola TaxID=375674 RepID=A0AA37RUC3_9GAMM|nr:hypothetical protein [Paraferrimonas sedimenticola]GLP95313.1 hypothetical protein GCM10007895_06190 [Paraferrimonas sedimenticola]
MNITLERLFTTPALKTANWHSGGGRSVIRFEREDALGIISQLEANCPIGCYMLAVRIANCPISEAKLKVSITGTLIQRGFTEDKAKALAIVLLAEHVGTTKCPKCRGTGERISRRYGTIRLCNDCGGSGQMQFTTKRLARRFANELGRKYPHAKFLRNCYPHYQRLGNELLDHLSKAQSFARTLLNELNWE